MVKKLIKYYLVSYGVGTLISAALFFLLHFSGQNSLILGGILGTLVGIWSVR